jgi:hypothetical protein
LERDRLFEMDVERTQSAKASIWKLNAIKATTQATFQSDDYPS